MEPKPIVDFGKLAEIVKRHREHRGVTLREVAEETGVSASTLSRIERGDAKPDLDTVRALVDWVGVALDAITREPAPQKRTRRGRAEQMAETLTHVEVHLRADPNLDDDAAKALVDILKAAYSTFAKGKG